MKKISPMWKKIIGEFVGCFALGYIGLGTIVTGIIYGFGDLFAIGVMFGLTIMFAVIIAAPLSGAVLNPAITLAQACFKKFPWRDVPAYIITQVIGWGLGCLLLFATFDNAIALWEGTMSIVRGTPADVYTAQIFMCNMPNMLCALGMGAGLDSGITSWPVWASIVNEVLATALLTISVLIFTDPKNGLRPSIGAFPLWLGFIIALAIMFFLPGSTACMNPARDLGPRIVLWLFGYESAFPGLGWGSGGYWWIWWPVCTFGAILAAWFFYKFMCPALCPSQQDDTKDAA